MDGSVGFQSREGQECHPSRQGKLADRQDCFWFLLMEENAPGDQTDENKDSQKSTEQN
jgi:hypothetical protein